MGKGINIPIGSDTKEFSQGVKRGVIEPLEDAADSLDDVAKAGDKAGQKLEDGFEDARKEVSAFKREQSELGKVIAAESKQAGKALGKNYKDGTDDGREGLRNLKEEAGQTARESAASISSVGDAGSALQETLANAFTGFGPAGAAAGIAAAIGLGLVLEQLTKQKEATEELKQSFAAAYRSAADEGRTYLDSAQIIAAAQDIIFDPEKYKTAREEAKLLNVDVLTLIQAQSGDQKKLNAVIQAGVEAERRRKDEISGSLGIQGNRAALVDDELKTIEKVNDKITATKGFIEDNQEAARNSIRITEEQEAAEAQRTQEGIRGIEAQGARLQAYADQAGQLKNPKLTVELDTKDYDKKLAALKAQKHETFINAVTLRNGQRVP